MEEKYCPDCKEKIDGKYCSECGSKGIEKNNVDGLVTANWREEKDLARIVKNKEVQVFIKQYLDKTKNTLSAEEFFERVDLVFSPLTGFSLKKLAEVTVPLYKKMGIKTGKFKIEHFEYSPQEVLIKILCSLAQHKYPIKEVNEASNGLILVAEIPSSMKTFGGEIIITLENKIGKTSVSVNSIIRGQLYDWGKSKSIVKALFADIENIQIELDSQ
ncbi:hypothetical protein [Maribacter sp. Asnod2-G09]|uniref:hypothetical protein n=1 Tax=Maribacter sp. Asnod2-G09 TaxID=3160577 RepID=UPI00386AE183